MLVSTWYRLLNRAISPIRSAMKPSICLQNHTTLSHPDMCGIEPPRRVICGACIFPRGPCMGKALLSILRVITLSLSCGTRYQWMLSEANGVRDMSLERFSTANTMKMSYRPSGSVIYPDSQRAASPPWRGISYRTERYPLSTPRRGARRKSTIPLCRITNLISETCSPHKITSRHHIPKCHSE